VALDIDLRLPLSIGAVAVSSLMRHAANRCRFRRGIGEVALSHPERHDVGCLQPGPQMVPQPLTLFSAGQERDALAGVRGRAGYLDQPAWAPVPLDRRYPWDRGASVVPRQRGR
jgi:hypothetical protein